MRGVSVPWLVLFAGGWWALVSARPDSWPAGILAVAAGLLLRGRMGGPSRSGLRWRGLLGFLPFFLDQMIRSGLDVSRRAFSPSLPLSPDLLHYRVSLPDGPARIFFVNSISLLPGTVSARARPDEIVVHRLSRDAASEDLLRTLEDRIAGLFGVEPGQERGE